jgi:hypothetical protein
MYIQSILYIMCVLIAKEKCNQCNQCNVLKVLLDEKEIRHHYLEVLEMPRKARTTNV